MSHCIGIGISTGDTSTCGKVCVSGSPFKTLFPTLDKRFESSAQMILFHSFTLNSSLNGNDFEVCIVC